MPQKVRIALDAMGGDAGASVVIPGAAISLTRHPGTEFLLFGDRVAQRSRIRIHTRCIGKHLTVKVKAVHKEIFSRGFRE